jgi:hypothetical protein
LARHTDANAVLASVWVEGQLALANVARLTAGVPARHVPASQVVLSLGDGFEVFRVDARLVHAEVVKVQPFGDRPDQ